jgi:hypothetical protein
MLNIARYGIKKKERVVVNWWVKSGTIPQSMVKYHIIVLIYKKTLGPFVGSDVWIVLVLDSLININEKQ